MLRALQGADAGGASDAPGSLAALLTVCIKHTPAHSRRLKLKTLLRSIRQEHGRQLQVLVASEPSRTIEPLLRGARMRVSHVALPAGAGLSAGRNALVAAVRTPYLALMDDDLVVHDGAALPRLLAALQADPSAALAGGCYDRRGPDGADCFNLRFRPSEDGAIVTAVAQRRLDARRCHRVHVTHNFFVARATALRRFGWDARQKVMEHETFFYQLYLNEQRVIACPGATIGHNGTIISTTDPYELHSLRGSAFGGGASADRGIPYLQYLCKNFPEVTRFVTPYWWWLCDQRRLCSPDWRTQLPFDARYCIPMPWNASDDASAISRPLVEPYRPADLFPRIEALAAGSPSGPGPTTALAAVDTAARAGGGAESRHVPLLVMILTRRSYASRRAAQRATWPSFSWHAGPLDPTPAPWRYVYVRGREADETGPAAEAMFDRLVGDVVTLRRAEEGYSKLVHKTMEALRWALAHVPFGWLLKTDDDSIVHVGRLWHWLATGPPSREGGRATGGPAGAARSTVSQSGGAGSLPRLVYAGRLLNRSQVIRPGFRRKDLWDERWYPADFLRWAVPHEAYSGDVFPTYASGGGYVLGVDAARKVLAGFDARPASRTFPLEDALVGVIAHEAGLTPMEMPGSVDLLDSTQTKWGDHEYRTTFAGKRLVHRVANFDVAFRWLVRDDGKPAAHGASGHVTV